PPRLAPAGGSIRPPGNGISMTAMRIEKTATAPASRRAAKRRTWKQSGTTFALLMVAPACILLCLVLLYPAYVALESSFYRIETITRQETYVGLRNYARLLSEPDFWQAFRRSLVWTIGAVSTPMVVGIGVALVLHKQVKGR